MLYLIADITQFDSVALIPLCAFLLTLGRDCKLVPDAFSKGTTPAWQANCLALSNFLNSSVMTIHLAAVTVPTPGIEPGRFLWFKQGLTYNFYHIFHLAPPQHTYDE